MVFWNGWINKIKQAISRKEFDALTKKVTKNETDIDVNKKAIATKADVSALANKADNSRIDAIDVKINTNTQNIASKANDNQVVKLSGNQTINGNKDFRGIPTFATHIKAGYGAGAVALSPEDNSAKQLQMFHAATGSNCYFNINMGSKGTIQNIPTPNNNGDATNKSYVDSTIASNLTNYVRISGSQNISGRKTFDDGFNSSYMYAINNSSNYIYINSGGSYIALRARDHIDCNSVRVRNVASPVDNTDAATKGYVDGKIGNATETKQDTIECREVQTSGPISKYYFYLTGTFIDRKRLISVDFNNECWYPAYTSGVDRLEIIGPSNKFSVSNKFNALFTYART